MKRNGFSIRKITSNRTKKTEQESKVIEVFIKELEEIVLKNEITPDRIINLD